MTNQTPRITLTIHVPVPLAEAFKATAKAEGLSHAALLAKLVDNHTRQSKKPRSGAGVFFCSYRVHPAVQLVRQICKAVSLKLYPISPSQS